MNKKKHKQNRTKRNKTKYTSRIDFGDDERNKKEEEVEETTMMTATTTENKKEI